VEVCAFVDSDWSEVVVLVAVLGAALVAIVDFVDDE
jgi:hypothetical protein